MGKKDIVEKDLLGCADVAADAVNVLMFCGKKQVDADTFVPAYTETIYEGSNRELRNQMEDVAKYDMQGGRIQALYLISNQTGIDGKMLFRKAGYVGGAYRMQCGNPRWQHYPVVHMVLYWGRRRWRAPRNMREYFAGHTVSKELWKYIETAQVYVYEMRYLTLQERERFTSDLRIVTEYLANPGGVASLEQPVEHPQELLRFLHTLSGDRGYLELAELLGKIGQTDRNEKGEKWRMCELLDKYRVGEYWDKVRELSAELEQEQKAREKEHKEREKERKAKERERKAKEQERRAKEWERKAKEQERKAKEQERITGLRALVTTCRQLNASFEITLEALKKNFSLDDESARQQIKLYW